MRLFVNRLACFIMVLFAFGLTSAFGVVYRQHSGTMEVFDPAKGWVRSPLSLPKGVSASQDLLAVWDVYRVFIYDTINHRDALINISPSEVKVNERLVVIRGFKEIVVYDSYVGKLKRQGFSDSVQRLIVNDPSWEELSCKFNGTSFAVPLAAYMTSDSVVVYDPFKHDFQVYRSYMGLSSLTISRGLVAFVNSFRKPVVYDPSGGGFMEGEASLRQGSFVSCPSGAFVYKLGTSVQIYDPVRHKWVYRNTSMGYQVSCDRKVVLIDDGAFSYVYALGRGWLER